MKKLFLIRHAETEHLSGNPCSKLPNDSPLSPRGRTQVESLVQKLSTHTVDLVLSSLYRRAQETATLLNARWKAPLFSSMALNEYFLREDGTGVESVDQALVRSLNYLNQFRCDFDSIAIVSHNAILSTLATGLLNLPFKEGEQLFSDPGTTLVLEYDWKIGQDRWEIASKVVPSVN